MLKKTKQTMPKVNSCQFLWNAPQAPLAPLYGNTWRLAGGGQRVKTINFRFQKSVQVDRQSKGRRPKQNTNAN
ncbi:MAG: hypothetical protein IPP59_10560 [Betaproteobacteria bacterium]|nr:hypothetical protein [Candidatus Dechloromonas phosphorivorans]